MEKPLSLVRLTELTMKENQVRGFVLVNFSVFFLFLKHNSFSFYKVMFVSAVDIYRFTSFYI